MSDCRDVEQYQCDDAPEYDHQIYAQSEFGTEHNIFTQSGFNIPFRFKNDQLTLYHMKTSRKFTISGEIKTDTELFWVNQTSCEGLATPPCLAWCTESETTGSGLLSEFCSMERDTILYYDIKNNIILYKHESETLNFDVTTTELTQMRGKWGMSNHLKYRINGATIFGNESYILFADDQQETIHSVVYTKTPSWMMGPIGIPTTGNGVVYPNPEDCEGYPNTDQIIIWPMPQSKAIPWDLEVRCKGFYDYGSEFPGDIPAIVEKDGGKDFYYPSWIRESMIEDPFWKASTASRFSQRFYGTPPLDNDDFTLKTYNVVPKGCGNLVSSRRYGRMLDFAFVDRNNTLVSFTRLGKIEKDQSGKDTFVLIGSGNPANTLILPEFNLNSIGPQWAHSPISLI